MIDAVNRGIAKAGLKAGGVFPEVMQQPGEMSFGAGVEGGGEFRGEPRDVFEMRAERLPLPGGFGQAVALGVFGGVSVINHAQNGGGLRMIIAWG